MTRTKIASVSAIRNKRPASRGAQLPLVPVEAPAVDPVFALIEERRALLAAINVEGVCETDEELDEGCAKLTALLKRIATSATTPEGALAVVLYMQETVKAEQEWNERYFPCQALAVAATAAARFLPTGAAHT